MKIANVITALCFGAAVILGGCSDSKVSEIPLKELPPPISEAVQDKGLSGYLSISSYWDFHMGERAAAFMELHPDVMINLDAPKYDDLITETQEQYILRTSTALMSGTACDLIDLSGMSVYRYAKSGLLCNLYDFMDKDSSFQKDDYYINIFKAMEYNGGLYILPFVFDYDLVYMNKPVAEKLGIKPDDYASLNYKEMLDIYNMAIQSGAAMQPFDLVSGITKERFWDYEFYNFYSPEIAKAHFDSIKFLEYLNLTNTISPMEYDFDRVTIGNEEFMRHCMFSFFNSNALDIHNYLLDYQNVCDPIPYVSSEGAAVFETLKASYGIFAGSQNKELAWEFIKFCIEERQPPENIDTAGREYQDYMLWYEGWIPINKANFYNLFRYCAKAGLQDLQADAKIKGGDVDAILDKALDRTNEYNLQRNTVSSDRELLFLVTDDLDRFYYDNSITAEETAANIQFKVMAYLNE